MPEYHENTARRLAREDDETSFETRGFTALVVVEKPGARDTFGDGSGYVVLNYAEVP